MTLEVRVVEGGFAEKKLIEAQVGAPTYVDDGEGAPTVFRHGAPNSPRLWRKVMPAYVGLGRLTACDLIGMGDNDKLQGLRPDCPPAAQLIGRACG